MISKVTFSELFFFYLIFCLVSLVNILIPHLVLGYRGLLFIIQQVIVHIPQVIVGIPQVSVSIYQAITFSLTFPTCLKLGLERDGRG